MNVLYDAKGYEYPINEYGHTYVPLEMGQAVTGPEQDENIKDTKI